jgi:DNA-directed RNA polymerase subunit beta'
LAFLPRNWNSIIYYERYVVVQAGVMASEGVKALDFLTEEEYFDILDKITQRKSIP